MNFAQKKRIERLRDKVAYVCPICEKPTDFNSAVVRYPKGLHAMEKISSGDYKWQCGHCKAWHRQNNDTVLP